MDYKYDKAKYPTPWNTTSDEFQISTKDATGKTIFAQTDYYPSFNSEALEKAEFCVNVHDDLVAALEKTRDELINWQQDFWATGKDEHKPDIFQVGNDLQDVIEHLKAALARARGEVK